MNERIRALALQAGEHANSVYVPPVRSKTPGKIWEDGHVDWHDLFNENFAELIVQECGRVLEDNELGGYRVHYVLREHFGVES